MVEVHEGVRDEDPQNWRSSDGRVMDHGGAEYPSNFFFGGMAIPQIQIGLI